MTEAHLGRGLSGMLSGMARELLRGPGPERWCKTCGRKHSSRTACPLITIAVKLPSGNVVERRVHSSRVPRP